MTRRTGFSPATRKVMAERSSGVDDIAICEIRVECVGTLAAAFHHRRPRQRGGSKRPETNQAANGVAACNPCHDWVESNRTEAKKLGWLLEQNQIPEDELLLYRGHRQVLLTNDGDVIEGVAA